MVTNWSREVSHASSSSLHAGDLPLFLGISLVEACYHPRAVGTRCLPEQVADSLRAMNLHTIDEMLPWCVHNFRQQHLI